MRIATLSAIAAGLGTMRIMGHTEPAFQAAAHLFCGGLIFSSFVCHALSKKQWIRLDGSSCDKELSENAGIYGALGWGLAILELTCFLVFKFRG